MYTMDSIEKLPLRVLATLRLYDLITRWKGYATMLNKITQLHWLPHILIINLALLSISIEAEEKTLIYTSNFSPMVNIDQKKIGYAHEIVKYLFDEAELGYEVVKVPWARAQLMVKQTPHSLIFPLTYTETRAASYNWGLKIFNTGTRFVTINGEHLTAESAYNRVIGVQMKSSWDNWLTEHNYPEIHRDVREGDIFVKLLKLKRIDTWLAEQHVINYTFAQHPELRTTKSKIIQKFNTFLASNKKLPFQHFDKLKIAMTALKKKGRYKQIFDDYGLSL